MTTCPTDNTQALDQTSFWSENGINWDAHRIGWAISGGCAVLHALCSILRPHVQEIAYPTVIITLFSVLSHCRNYSVPAEQRQIIRILYMPPVYAIISFFSYRYFRSYTYYELIEVVYEAVTLSAFMLLIIEYVAGTASEHNARKALERKDKHNLPLPLCCWRYRPTKPYFLYTMKWLVLQYVIVRPLVSIAGIICQAYNILCEDEGLTHFEYAYPYLSIVDFVSISLSLYGLFVFYGLTKDELKNQRPLAKFLCIKLIVMFTFYQSFVFEALQGRVIHATAYWTETNIANGLNALAICIEMVFFAAAMMWSYPASPYKQAGVHTGIGRPLWDSINFSDFGAEIWGSLKFFIDYMRGKPDTRTPKNKKVNMAQAFGVEESGPSFYQPDVLSTTSSDMYAPTGIIPGNKAGIGAGPGARGGSMKAYAPTTAMSVNPIPLAQGRGYTGRDGNVDQYAEDVRLTTFPPRVGTASPYERDSDETTADGSYPLTRTKYGPDRRQY